MNNNGVKQITCFDCQQRRRSEWSILSEDEYALLNEVKVCRDYQQKEVIFSEGEQCQGVYCVESGLVGVRKTAPEGDSVLVRLAFPGETLGYRPCLAEEPHRGIGEALENSIICFIADSVVRHLISRNPALGLKFLKRAARSMGEAEEKYFENVTLDVRTRFSHLLAVLVNRYGKTNGGGEIIFEMPLSRQDLAALIGTRPESLSRIIRNMEEDGIVSFSGRNVCIPEKEILLNEL